jgi:hypothetical protein
MQIIRSPADAANIADPAIRQMILQRIDERFRFLSSSTHSEPMAGGTTISFDSKEDKGWIDIPPGSGGETVLKIVCAQWP